MNLFREYIYDAEQYGSHDALPILYDVNEQ